MWSSPYIMPLSPLTMEIAERFLAVLGVILILKFLSTLLRQKLYEKMTAVGDLTLLGLPRKDGRKIQGTAVICGGSIAGLLSARVCSDHFEKVIIVEPEAWVTTDEGQHDRHREAYYSPGLSAPKRSRVAQYNHIHLYQIFTTLALRKLFPDADAKIKRAGGRFYPHISRYHLLGVPLLGPYSEPMDGIPTSLHSTRPAYETGLRKLVLTHCPNVEYMVGSVIGLVPHHSGKSVTSVLVRTHSGDEGPATELAATMVVDCTGPAHGGLRWLQDPRFQVTSATGSEKRLHSLDHLKVSYDPKVAYSTCEYYIPPDLREELKEICLPLDFENLSVLYTNIPKLYEDTSTASIQKREDNYLQVLCGGADYRDKITSVDDIRNYFSNIPVLHPLPAFIFAILDFLDKYEISATYIHMRSTPRQYVQYFRARLPSNFIALGDSVLMLNPIRGQGCTSACVDAVTLNALLARSTPVTSPEKHGKVVSLPDDFSRNFFSVQSQRSGTVWNALKTDDYAWKSTIHQPGDDPNSRGSVLKRWYSKKLLELATKDAQFAHDFLHVEQYLAPSTDLFAPTVIVKVAWLHVSQILGFQYPFSSLLRKTKSRI